MTSRDNTSRVFAPEQASAYASGRGGSYPDPIYQTILDYHTGARDSVLNVGAGPGKAIWDLLRYFKTAIGCDSSLQMIEQAQKDAITQSFQARTSFLVAGAEECAEAVGDAKLGLMTVAMAAHWFDLPKFYNQAARVLKSGGTLAMFTCSSFYVLVIQRVSLGAKGSRNPGAAQRPGRQCAWTLHVAWKPDEQERLRESAIAMDS